MPECVLAQGAFDGVAATAAGPPLAFTSQAGQGANIGQAWDLRTRSALGPPIPDFPDHRAEWTFGLLPDGAPVAAWTHRDRVHVHDLSTGAEFTVDGQPDLVGLAVHEGRGAVVAVFGPASDAKVVVWDARTGDPRAEFGIWLGHWTAIDRWILHAVPASGPLVGLACDTERVIGILDVEREEEAASLPSSGSHPVLAPGPDGSPLLVQPDGASLLVRTLDGDTAATLTAPADIGPVAASVVDDRFLAAAAVADALVVWDAASAVPSHRAPLPSTVNDLALTTDGTLVAATDTGLHTTSP
ncbi:hypothetical protein [Actinomadura opuntiae]|uniref:hypothetical protein n=1 Tax=Actinomadura sp. OS1-43 TaxID=604315 RepID=UPI00255B1357|nr:hypothetical protein [Actinomadura sp. OS1-43]MDL4819802.1 hypothetical protein [Actinomadura sp. OS1-43]